MNEKGWNDASAAGGEQRITVLQIRGEQGRDSSLRAAAVLETVPGTRRILLDEAGEALVVRSTQKASALRRALRESHIASSVVSRVSGRGGSGVVDQAVLALLILAVQIVLAWRDFGLGWPLLPAVQAGATIFVMFVLAAPLLREAAAWLGRFRASVELALVTGAAAAWLAGALSMFRLEAEGQPYFALATLITACGLLAHAAKSTSRTISSSKLQSLLQLLPDKAIAEQRGQPHEMRTEALRRGHVVHVEHGERFPADGIVVNGSGQVDEGTITGVDRPYHCGPGDSVLAGTMNLGEARRVRITARSKDSAVVLLARLAADAAPTRVAMRGSMDLYVLWGFLGVVALAVVTVIVGWVIGRGLLASLEIGLLVTAAGSPASLALAGPFAYSIAVMTLRRWGIWVRDPLAIERAAMVNLLVISAEGVVTEGAYRVLKSHAVGGGDERRLIGIAAAALQGSEYKWADQVDRAAIRLGAPERELQAREYQGSDGVVALVRDGQRTHQVTVGPEAFLTLHGITINPTFLQTELPGEPAAVPLFVAIDGHGAGAIWMIDPVRLNARGAVRHLRANGVETCLMGHQSEKGLEQIAGTVDSDSYVVAEDAHQQVAEIEDMRAGGQIVAMVGHPVRDAAGLATADLGIGFGALNSPAAARPGFLVRDASALLVAACFSVARLTQLRLLQSMAMAVAPMLAAVVLALLGRLDLGVGLALIGASAAVVLINSLRMLRWRPQFTSGGR